MSEDDPVLHQASPKFRRLLDLAPRSIPMGWQFGQPITWGCPERDAYNAAIAQGEAGMTPTTLTDTR